MPAVPGATPTDAHCHVPVCYPLNLRKTIHVQ